jgi:hypothetical protein
MLSMLPLSRSADDKQLRTEVRGREKKALAKRQATSHGSHIAASFDIFILACEPTGARNYYEKSLS